VPVPVAEALDAQAVNETITADVMHLESLVGNVAVEQGRARAGGSDALGGGAVARSSRSGGRPIPAAAASDESSVVRVDALVPARPSFVRT